MPRVETMAARRPDPALVEDAAAALRSGKLVVLPTETVYGLAARADDPKALERIVAAKGRAPDKPLARLVAGIEDVEAAVGPLPRAARLLAERFWPGPLTLVLEAASGERIGFRVPGLVFAREAVALSGVPVVATSANLSGGEEPVTASAALAAVGEKVDVVYDAGPALLARPSTVVSVPRDGARDGAFQVLREGFLSPELLARALLRVVLFVCTGNTCRSPMAEGIMKAKLASRLGVAPSKLEEAGWSVVSAGTSAMGGGGAAEAAVQVMRERGIDIAAHRSRALTPELVDAASVVYVMSSSHAHTIDEWLPEASAKVRLLDEEGVPDPVGQSVERYRETADLLERRIAAALDDLLSSRVG